MEPLQAFWTYTPGGGPVRHAGHCGRFGTELVAHGASRATCPGCGRAHFQNPLPAVSVLVVERGEVLLVRRRAAAFEGGRWCLPAGYIDHGEDFLTAGRREVEEEAGVAVEVEAIISVVSNFFAPDRHSLVIVLRARLVGGELVAGDDADDAGWFAPGRLPPLAFEADDHIIRRHFAAPIPGAPVDPRFARG